MSIPADPQTTIVMRDFPGLIIDADPRDLESGASREQVNLVCFVGQLNVRKGLAPLSFEAVVDAT